MEIFINYRTDDSDWAAMQIDDKLSARLGSEQVFRSSRSIELGTEFPPQIWQALRRCSIFLALIGPHWLTTDQAGRRKIDRPDDYVRWEIATALELNLRVIPVLLGTIRRPVAADLPPDVAPLVERQYVRLHTRESGYDLDRLVGELERWIPAAPPGQVPAQVPGPTARGAASKPAAAARGGMSIGTANVTGTIVGGDVTIHGDQHIGSRYQPGTDGPQR